MKYTLMAAIGLLLATTIPASAARGHYQQQQYAPHMGGFCDNSGRYCGSAPAPQPARRAVAHYKKRAAKKQHTIDANGNAALAEIHTAAGLTAKVASYVREKFQAFIDAVEADTVPDTGAGYFVDATTIKGNRITDIGCFDTHGHMPHSKHYRGLACDIGQIRRNVTTDKFMYHVASIAHRLGLTDGCEWARKRGERYTGPDCGHIEVPATQIAAAKPHRQYASRHHRRHRYAAM